MLLHLGEFDPDWYMARYPDVAELGLSAEAHFTTVGYRIGRGMSANCHSTSDRPEISAALSRRPEISYCVPVMDRLEDLKATLSKNLLSNKGFREQVEFVVLSYEDSGATFEWVRAHFGDALRSGYLRLIRMPRLPVWHFGRAKNGFRGRLAGRFYSSLDGDNFVTGEETRQLLSVIKARGETFIFHHFSGQWGDGSSGRISLPARYFDAVGYDETFLPRQFDEVDLILSTLAARPELTLCRYGAGDGVLEADSVRGYLKGVKDTPAVTTYPAPKRPAPVNPRAGDYAAEDAVLAAMQGVNEALSFLKNAPGSSRRAEWVGRLRRSAEAWVDATDARTLHAVLFDAVDLPPEDPLEITCLVPGAGANLSSVHPKIVIDARGEPLPAGATEEGDFVLHPASGHPLVADVLWRAGLAKVLAARGCPPVS